MKLLIGIPAHNEAEKIAGVVGSLPSKINGNLKVDILVLDDGSTDKTSALARKAGAVVLIHLLNRGLGGALKTIFTYARINRYDYLVTVDADGQHLQSDILKIIGSITEDKYDSIIGNRWSEGKNIPVSRLIVNQLANLLTFLLYGYWVKDSQSGLRAFNKNAIGKIQIATDGMEVSSEIIKEIFRNKLKYKEIPIHAVYTDYSKSKGQRLTNSSNIFVQLLIRFIK